jgi:predicted GNAT superfamily acetyltransferase
VSGSGGPGAEIRLVTHRRDVEALADVFGQVWGASTASAATSPEILRAVAHAGGYLAAAIDHTGAMVGGSMAFRGLHDGHQSLHSHITGVVPGVTHQGVGRALKQHQRAWARAQQLACITWTFDPLVRRNGWFNLQTLGAHVEEYLIDFYGPLGDDINGNDETDRLLAVWWIDGRRAGAAADGLLAAPSDTTLEKAVRIVTVGDDGGPAYLDPDGGDRDIGDVRLVAVPDDIVAIRQGDPPTALRWRHAVRDALAAPLGADWTITDMTTDGSYVLRRRPPHTPGETPGATPRTTKVET